MPEGLRLISKFTKFHSTDRETLLDVTPLGHAFLSTDYVFVCAQ